jgi:plastocyanin
VSSSSSTSSRSSKHAKQTFTITYTDKGFQPSFLSVRAGDVVKFRNQSPIGMWVASNPHPTHTDYIEFDAGNSVNANGEYSFTFNRVGVWGFHNHLNPNHQAVISVDVQ